MAACLLGPGVPGALGPFPGSPAEAPFFPGSRPYCVGLFPGRPATSMISDLPVRVNGNLRDRHVRGKGLCFGA